VGEIVAIHNAHVRSLQDARDLIDRLVGSPAAEMPRKIERILEGIAPRFDGGPVKAEDYFERAGKQVRDYIKSRFHSNS
jgi:hypothetical protein